MVGLIRCVIILLLAALALIDALLVQGFVASRKHNIGHTTTTTRTLLFVDKQQSLFQRNNLPLFSKGNEEEDAASLDLDDQALLAASSASSSAESFNNFTLTLTNPSSFVNQSRDTSVSNNGNSLLSSKNIIAVVVSVATLLALSQLLLPQIQVLATVIITTYSKLLAEYPLPTKSLTSGALCGLSDVIAQYREVNRKQFNYKRWIRFAGKFFYTSL